MRDLLWKDWDECKADLKHTLVDRTVLEANLVPEIQRAEKNTVLTNEGGRHDQRENMSVNMHF